MTNTIFAQILSMITLVVAPEAADGPGARGHHGKGAGMCERLECTDDQRTQIDAIRAEHRSEVADERAEVKRLRAAMKTERSAAQPNAEKLAGLKAQLDAVKTKLEQARSESKAEVAAVLTPAQRERMAKMKAEHKARGKGKRGKDAAHGKRDGKGKATAKRERGPKDKATAKRDRGPKGKATAKRARTGARAFATG